MKWKSCEQKENANEPQHGYVAHEKCCDVFLLSLRVLQILTILIPYSSDDGSDSVRSVQSYILKTPIHVLYVILLYCERDTLINSTY